MGRSGIAMVMAMAAALAAAPSAHAYAHATFTVSPNPGLLGSTFIFDASGSTGVHFLWDLDGDGTYETDTGASRQAVKTYTGAGTIIVGLEVFDSDGSVDTTNLPVTVLAPSEPPPVQEDITPPVITNASITPRSFRVAPGATPLNATIASIRRGARLTWTLSEDASLGIRIQTCRTATKCSHVTVKMHRTVPAGTRSMPFTGRIELRRLKPGRYRFALDATDAAGNFSSTVYVPFVLLPG